MTRETIAAIATAQGPGGVGIVRVSGPAAVEIIARMIGRDPRGLGDRHLVHGVARDPETGERLDEVLSVVMRGPRSYTGEDVGEIHGHGGTVNLGRLLGAALKEGARPAEPGEFTRRAFENGRLDLTRAEAVAQVIGAASERALRMGQAQLDGALGRRIDALRQMAVALLAELEATIDFPEEDLEEDLAGGPPLVSRAAELEAAAKELAGTHALGRALREGVEVALVGKPNVGKSSLLNALLEEERAVVTSEPGTTRDYLEARAVWEGVAVTLIDTAGERAVAANEAEQRGLELGRARARRADLVVHVLDATVVAETEELASRESPGDELTVFNKVDLASAPEGSIGVSALTGAGLGELRREVMRRVLGTAGEGDEGAVVATARQRALLEEVAQAAGRAKAAALGRQPPELIAADLRTAAWRLGAVTGERVEEAVLDAIFAKFCLGK